MKKYFLSIFAPLLFVLTINSKVAFAQVQFTGIDPISGLRWVVVDILTVGGNEMEPDHFTSITNQCAAFLKLKHKMPENYDFGWDFYGYTKPKSEFRSGSAKQYWRYSIICYF